MSLSTIRCSKCHVFKAPELFYNNKATPNGKFRQCKACCDALPRQSTQAKLIRNRARNRAVAKLVKMYQVEYDSLMAQEIALAWDELEAINAAAAGRKPITKPVRLRSGPRRETDEGPRIDYMWCEDCLTYHNNDHHEVPAVAKRTANQMPMPSEPERLNSFEFIDAYIALKGQHRTLAEMAVLLHEPSTAECTARIRAFRREGYLS